MAVKKTIYIDVETGKANSKVDSLGNNINSVSTNADNVSGSLKGVDNAAKKAGSSLKNVGENGGAIALLDSVTGGLATKMRDAFEATKLFNFSLKATRGALISTGIGALVVAVGLLVAYWDDIVEYIGGANKKLQAQVDLNKRNLGILELDLELVKSREKLLEAEGKSTKTTKEERKKILETLLNENTALISNLELQLERAKSATNELGTWSKILNAAKIYTGIGTIEVIDEEAAKKADELTESIKKAKIQSNELRGSLIDIDRPEEEDSPKRKPEGDKAPNKDTSKEEDYQKKVDEIREKYRQKREDDEADSEKKRLDLAERSALKELEGVENAEKARMEILEYYDGKRRELAKDSAIKEREELEALKAEFRLTDEEKEIEDLEKEKEKKLAKLDELGGDLETRKAIVAKYAKDEADIKKKYSDKSADLKDKELEDEKILQMQKMQVIGDAFGAIGQLLDAAGEENKAFAATQALVNTFLGVTQVWAAKSTIPEPYGTIAKVASTITVVASGMSALKRINSADSTGGASAGGFSTGAPQAAAQPQAPEFNLIGSGGVNQVAQSLNERNDRPVKTYVVSKDITSEQELDRNVRQTASFG